MSLEASVNFTIRFDQPLKVWVLQLGGWLPIQFTGVGVVLIDRNVTSALSKLTAWPARTDMQVEKWWLNQLNSERYLLNTVLCASEGRTGQTPSFDEFCGGIAEANEILARGLPKARTIQHDPLDFERLYENVIATSARHEREADFLITVAPLIASRVSSANTEQIECAIIDAAELFQLSLHSFIVLAALSCLYEPQSGDEPRIGWGVIKPKQLHTRPMAYNALADIRSLEFLAAASGLSGPSAGFCTRDKYLAAFWTCLGVSAPTWDGNKFSAAINPNPKLFPRLNTNAVEALFARLL